MTAERRPSRARTAPDARGTTHIVTGGTGGLGYWAAEQLAAAGASVVVAARSEARGEAALASLKRHVPGADVSFVHLDLADQSSVARAADELSALPHIDSLLANAGVLSTKGRRETTDGFETMMGTNLLGHAALIGRMLPALSAQPSARVVSLGSISHEFFRLDLDDLQSTKGRFREFRSYGRSKLAVMTFAFELDRRLRAAGSPVSSLVAHPGFAVDELAPARDILPRPKTGTALSRAAFRTIGQGKDAGARPLVAAVTDSQAAGGQYWGPDGWRQLKGSPAIVAAKNYARDPAVGRALWAEVESLTGVRFGLDPA
ncbi:SDR family NAD(P)-dependent oxidoreductase [Herbiconiux sp. KACC 21604]|uniref:SDR family NAD(P)-dependent oxidoreductase n=1 Tax=unclassified Herbiconiux TaxID=2618217 RepID=UPI001490B0CE|nr:SDR family NAD(P)-dependent oxidoreductase [Herbiconiux sp. SALV-R1]QJU53835.1 SDR family NAD(P)-dependent oxidoreductase [Herbiconiux sp. SALV-R1]WPO84846.1 SDR family NAD(P)-dependent oxidoreductase [Herbiconiux sp. KACC 21604]